MKKVIIIDSSISDSGHETLYESIDELLEHFPQRKRYSRLHRSVSNHPKFVGFIKAKYFREAMPTFQPVLSHQVHIMDEDNEKAEGEDELISEIRVLLNSNESKVAPTNSVFNENLDEAERNIDLLESIESDFLRDDESIKILRNMIERSFGSMTPLLRSRSMKVKLDRLKDRYNKIEFKIG